MFDADADVDVDVLGGVMGGWIGELVGEYIFVSGSVTAGKSILCLWNSRAADVEDKIWYDMNWYGILVAEARFEQI